MTLLACIVDLSVLKQDSTLGKSNPATGRHISEDGDNPRLSYLTYLRHLWIFGTSFEQRACHNVGCKSVELIIKETQLTAVTEGWQNCTNSPLLAPSSASPSPALANVNC